MQAMLAVKSLSKCVTLAFFWEACDQTVAQNSTNIHNTSLDGWMGNGEVSDFTYLGQNDPLFVLTSTIPQRTNAAGVIITDKSCLIMDEVDGMSAGDRGGVGALAALIRKTKVTFFFSFRKRAPH
jgi:replication factor C subunit 1